MALTKKQKTLPEALKKKIMKSKSKTKKNYKGKTTIGIRG